MTGDYTLADLEHYDPQARAGTKWRRFCCPLCGDDKPKDREHRSLALVVESGKWHCHRCKARGRLIEKREDDDKPHYERPRPRRQFVMPVVETVPDAEQQTKLKDILKTVVPLKSTPGVDYLTGRGIAYGIARRAKVNYSPEWGAAGRAVVFPVYDKNGKPVAAQGRSIDGDAKITYGSRSCGVFATADAVNSDPIAICEGPIDALALAACGLPAVALCGSAGMPRWFGERLGRRVERDGIARSMLVFIATDSDGAGEEAAVKLMSEVQRFGGKAKRLSPPDGVKDWAEFFVAEPLQCCDYVDLGYIETGYGMPTRPDPRPDLLSDSSVWIDLLESANNKPWYGPLHGFRCNGARLIDDELTIDEHSDWPDRDQFARDYVKWLVPYLNDVPPLAPIEEDRS